MLKTHKLCKVCQAIKGPGGKKLLNHIYSSSYYHKGSGESLATIALQYHETGWFNYDNLKTHAKKHQYMTEEDYNKRHLKHIVNQAEKQVLKRKVEAGEIWDTFLQKGHEMLQNDELPIKASDLLKATKDKTDFQLKKQDQELKLAEMIAFFASGEGDKEYNKQYDRRIIENQEVTGIDFTTEPTGALEEGENRPDTVYYPPTWDAPTPGTN